MTPAERIAAALERIADALEAPVDNEGKPAKPRKTRAMKARAAKRVEFYLRRHGHYGAARCRSEGDE